MKNKNAKGLLTALPFIAPSLGGFLLISLVPIVFSLALSLTSYSGLKGLNVFSAEFWQQNFVGLENYQKILSGGEFWESLMHIGYFIILYIPLMLATSLGIATLLNKPRKGSVFFRVLFYIPVLTSWVAGALIWRWVLDPQYGVVNDLLAKIGIDGPGWLHDGNWAMVGIVLASVWKDMGFYGLIFLGGLKNINPVYYEAAQMDGARKRQRFFRITIPMLSPIIYFVLVLSLINAFMIFAQVMIMTGGGPYGATEVIVERIYNYGFRYHKMGYASALSWILFAIVFILTFIQQKAQKKWVNYDA